MGTKQVKLKCRQRFEGKQRAPCWIIDGEFHEIRSNAQPLKFVHYLPEYSLSSKLVKWAFVLIVTLKTNERRGLTWLTEALLRNTCNSNKAAESSYVLDFEKVAGAGISQRLFSFHCNFLQPHFPAFMSLHLTQSENYGVWDSTWRGYKQLLHSWGTGKMATFKKTIINLVPDFSPTVYL